MEEEQDIQSDIVKRDQLLDSQKNKEFDDAVAGGELEDLREGVKIRKREKSEVKSDLLKSIGFEVGANLVLDKATNWLLGAPLPGSRFIYGGANFLGSAGINLYAQKMRGEEGIKWGEAGASGVTSLVPYMNPAAGKYAKYVGKPWSIQRGAVGGAATGLVHEGIRIGADEQRLPTPSEAAVGIGLGGAVGGSIPALAEGANRVGARLFYSIGNRNPRIAYASSSADALAAKTQTLRNQKTFLKLAKNEQDEILAEIVNLDDYIQNRLTNPTPSQRFRSTHPAQGYTGKRLFSVSGGKVIGLRVSKGEYKLFNKTSNTQIVKQRGLWDRASSEPKKVAAGFGWKTKKDYNKKAEEVLEHLLDTGDTADAELYYSIVGGTKPFQMEHKQWQYAGGNNPVWIKQSDGSFRHRWKTNENGVLIAPGDPENLSLVGIYDFKYLKDGLEQNLRKSGLDNDYYLDMDKSNNIIIMHNRNGVYPDGQPFRMDTPVAPMDVNPNTPELWNRTVTIHRSSSAEEGINAFNAIIKRSTEQNVPEASSELYRRTFSLWYLDPEGGSAGYRDYGSGYDKITAEIVKNDKIITDLRKEMFYSKDEVTKLRLLKKIRDYEDDNLILLRKINAPLEAQGRGD